MDEIARSDELLES